MTKKQAMGRDFFLSPSLYRKELLDLGGSSVWVREPSTYALSLFKEEGEALDTEWKSGSMTTDAYIQRANEISAKLVLSVVCDENGDIIGTEMDLGAIKLMPNRVINKIIGKAFDLSGVPYKQIEEVAANLKKEGLV
jgi:hypothetical protein